MAAIASLKGRVRGFVSAAATATKDAIGKGTPLDVALRSATQSGVLIDENEESLGFIVRASNDTDDRRKIMLHLHACLSNMSSTQWRSVHAALVVMEELLNKGSEDLMHELANGIHFDLVQRCSFLEQYEYGYDDRVEGLLRKKAASVRALWLQKQLDLTVQDAFGDDKEEEEEPAGVPQPSKRSPEPPITNLLDESTVDGESAGSCDTGSPREAARATATVPDLLGFNGPDTPSVPACTQPAAAESDTSASLAASQQQQTNRQQQDSPAPPAPEVDWLDMAKTHGLYSETAPSDRSKPQCSQPQSESLLELL